MRDFRELNQQVNEVKRMLNSFIQKLTAQVAKFGMIFGNMESNMEKSCL